MAINHSTCEQLFNKKYSVVSDYQLMLSYAREDAQGEVKQLKQELESLQLNRIFLDVEGIVGGDEWASVLNNEILNCDVFIPLMTPNYGFTKWTRREFHLADKVNKIIIPINFLKEWPPHCLAIYLSTIHYIEWDPEVKKTAEAIRNALLKKIVPGGFLGHKTVWLGSLGSIDKPFLEKPIYPNNWTEKGPELKPKIVISAHPEQKQFTEFLRINLSAKFQIKIWCSLDLSTHSHSLETYNQRLAKAFKSEAKSGETLFIIVLSKAYCLSKTCKQQAFYCDFRKKLVPIKYEEFEKPDWMSDLFTEDETGKPLTDLEWLSYTANDPDSFGTLLNQRISILMNLNEPVYDSTDKSYEERAETQFRFHSNN